MRFQCPFCRGIVAVDNTDLGIDVQCGHCSEIVTVPYSRVATGAVIADFIILEELGRGGMGIVYLAHQISLDRPAALKILADTYANNAEFVVGFIKEARAAAKLNHPHIVQAYAVGEDEGVFYFAMENVDGETMKSVLKRKKVIPVDQAVLIIQQIAEALDYAWKEQRLIHRDIKPDNIMLTTNNRAKLADLGLARVAGDLDDADDDEVMGTPQYISPEHLTGAPMDIRSDIYSLGATFYHLITGRFPFEGRTATEIARKHLEEKLVPPHVINPDIPEAVSRIIQKMMVKNVKGRYQDAESLVDDLRLVRRGKLPHTATGGVERTATGGMGSSSKKTVRINTKGRKTGQYPAVTSTKTTTTGSIKTTASGSHKSTGKHDLSRIQKEQAAKKKLLIIGIITAVVCLGAILFVVLHSLSKANNKGGAGGTSGGQKPPTNNGGTAAPVTTMYSKAIDEVLGFAKANPKSTDQIHKKCEDFFGSFPKPGESKAEKEKLAKLMELFAEVDEAKVVEARKVKYAAEKARLEEIAKQKEAERQRQLEVEQKRQEKERLEADKKAREKHRQEEAERKRREQIEKEDQYIASLESLKNNCRSRFIDYSKRLKFKDAAEVFGPACKEGPRAIADKKSQREIIKANEHTEWGKKMQKAIDWAGKVWTCIYDSGTKLEGLQIEVKRGVLGKITNIKGNKVTVKGFTGQTVTVSLSDLPGKQFLRMVKKASDLLGEPDAVFYYYLADGNFRYATEYAPSDEWKEELSKVALAYFKLKLKVSGDQEKQELIRHYRRMPEFIKAQQETD